MVAPVILAAWLGGAALTGIVGYLAYENWETIKKKVSGKSIVILGQRATGKTTLLNYLLKGEITFKHEATIGVKKVKISKKQLADLGWNVRLNSTQNDYSGVTSNYEQWLKALKNADIFIYLFKTDEWILDEGSVETQIEKDIKNIQKDLNGKNIPMFIIGTHLDLLEGIEFDTQEEKIKLIDELQNEAFFKNIKSRLNAGNSKAYLHFGSLKDEVGLNEIIHFIIGHMGE
ncbi:50S ribosome-binding GTPase [Acinetobacter albensis]|uniref:GTPase domain-containing protein n=1 Tax=Acinetobacter albensis TaxID=1673609 RepID=UPI001882E7FA|nr:GTPase domain-containing protein [Acinetobacter albensis]MBE9402049.1 50S ribosome-binding GTPase [Acinetobacter albensis]